MFIGGCRIRCRLPARTIRSRCFLRVFRMQDVQTSCRRQLRASVYAGWNVYHCARQNFHCFFSFLLIPSFSGHADENLSSAIVGVVDMPVIPASRFESDVGKRNLCAGYACKIAVACKYRAYAAFRSPMGNIISRSNAAFACLPLYLLPIRILRG